MLKQVGLVHNHVFFRKAAIEWAIAAGDFQRCVELAERHGLLRIIPANQCMSILTGGLRQIATARAATIRAADRADRRAVSQGEALDARARPRTLGR